MVHKIGLCVLIVLAVVHEICSQQNFMFDDQVAYRNLRHSSYTGNVKRQSYAQPVQQQQPNEQSEPTETHVIKHPDEKIVHHPSKIYVKRPATFVTINHPDIIIEPNPVVYHKPAAVVRSPVIYKQLPQKVQFRHVVKHIVKPIERKVLIEEKQKPLVKVFRSQPKYVLPQQAHTSDYVKSFQNKGSATANNVYQPQESTESNEPEDQTQENENISPLDVSRLYFKQHLPSNLAHYTSNM